MPFFTLSRLPVTAEERYQDWEGWTSSSGVSEMRNEVESALEGAVLSFAVESGGIHGHGLHHQVSQHPFRPN